VNCPVDGTTSLLSERQNVEIDYCPESQACGSTVESSTSCCRAITTATTMATAADAHPQVREPFEQAGITGRRSTSGSSEQKSRAKRATSGRPSIGSSIRIDPGPPM
jgi:hypothetical protein